MRSIGVLIVRLVVGGLLAGHGAQKLFGAFGGNGLQGTAQWMESMELKPGDAWARVAGGSELRHRRTPQHPGGAGDDHPHGWTYLLASPDIW